MSLGLFAIFALVLAVTSRYVVPATGQKKCYNFLPTAISCPTSGSFYGQDAQYAAKRPALSYVDNGDETVTDTNTGLMWTKKVFGKMPMSQAKAYTSTLRTGGYSDWRLPTIKELYSLISFNGSTSEDPSVAYIDLRYFVSPKGNTAIGERYIDAQVFSSTIYVSTVMSNMQCFFGVNFVDGRIKCYPIWRTSTIPALFYARYVRKVSPSSTTSINALIDAKDGTIVDTETGLQWTQQDSGKLSTLPGGVMDWQTALSFCEGLTLAGYSDWRLPNAKELQSIVDYSRSPATTKSPAISPLFQSTPITVDTAGTVDYAYYWTSTTHDDSLGFNRVGMGVYICFGRCYGFMCPNNAMTCAESAKLLQDVHGAGAQRSDPKAKMAGQTYPQSQGPQGDIRRVSNMARCVRTRTA